MLPSDHVHCPLGGVEPTLVSAVHRLTPAAETERKEQQAKQMVPWQIEKC